MPEPLSAKLLGAYCRKDQCTEWFLILKWGSSSAIFERRNYSGNRIVQAGFAATHIERVRYASERYSAGTCR